MLIPIIAALLRWKLLNKPLKLFFFFCLSYLLLNCLDFLYLFAVNNYTAFFGPWLAMTGNSLNFLLILYQLNNFIMLGWFFSLLLDDKNYGHGLKNTSIILSLAAILGYIIEKGWRNFGFFGPTAEAIFLFAIPLFYLWHLSRISHSVPSLKNPYFLISIGLAMPNLIGLFLYFVGDSIRAENFCLFARLSIARNCFVIIGQLLFALAFWRAHFTKYIPPTAI